MGYFWGGKSASGWNNSWGASTLVTAPGSEKTNTYQPFGLDCSGFVDWVYKTAGVGNMLAISDGENKTTFIDVTAWGNLAEVIGQYLAKGDELYIEGELRNKDISIGGGEGKTMQGVYILITQIKFTHGKAKSKSEDEEPDAREVEVE